MKVWMRNILMTALLVTPAYGQTAVPGPAAPTGPANSGLGVAADAAPAVQEGEAGMDFPIVRTIGGMGLVIVLMAAAFFAARKFAPRYFNKPASEKSVKLIETLSMGDKRSIVLIEVANNRFLVGSTPQQINLLAALPEALSVSSEPDEASAALKTAIKKESRIPFRNLFEIEKKRPSQLAGNPLPADLRAKMRQLRETLERP